MKNIEFKQEYSLPNSRYSGWIRPIMKGYYLACCDCGLTHKFEFRALRIKSRHADGDIGTILDAKDYQVEFRLMVHKGMTKKNRKQTCKKK